MRLCIPGLLIFEILSFSSLFEVEIEVMIFLFKFLLEAFFLFLYVVLRFYVLVLLLLQCKLILAKAGLILVITFNLFGVDQISKLRHLGRFSKLSLYLCFCCPDQLAYHPPTRHLKQIDRS